MLRSVRRQDVERWKMFPELELVIYRSRCCVVVWLHSCLVGHPFVHSFVSSFIHSSKHPFMDRWIMHPFNMFKTNRFWERRKFSTGFVSGNLVVIWMFAASEFKSGRCWAWDETFSLHVHRRLFHKWELYPRLFRPSIHSFIHSFADVWKLLFNAVCCKVMSLVHFRCNKQAKGKKLEATSCCCRCCCCLWLYW